MNDCLFVLSKIVRLYHDETNLLKEDALTSDELQTTAELARTLWTADRLKKLIHGKKLMLLPQESPELLRVMGLMNKDGSISPNQTKKYLQVNHLLQLVKKELDLLASQHKEVRVADVCCGSSYLSFMIAWYFKEKLKKPVRILGLDRDIHVVTRSAERAMALGYQDFMNFRQEDLGAETSAPTAKEERFHLSVALHACDVATDYAFYWALKQKSDIIAIAPCCQRELSSLWDGQGGQQHFLAPIFASPNLRRDLAATFTDSLRLLLVRSQGYEAIATEFISSSHTPKNRLLMAKRRGNFSTEALQQYQNLHEHLGHPSHITLGNLLGISQQTIND